MEGSGARGQHPANEVLAELRAAAGPLRIAEIAERLGVHPNTVRFHLGGLIERGQVERVEAAPTGPGRPAQLFRAVPGMDPGGPRHYRLLAELLLADLAAHPHAAAWAADAGRAWGARLGAEGARVEEPAQRLAELMADLGFAPEQPAAHDHIVLRHCPFLELAQQHPEVVCQVHLGMAQGLLAAWRAPIRAERLVPFAEPDRCLVQLSPVSMRESGERDGCSLGAGDR